MNRSTTHPPPTTAMDLNNQAVRILLRDGPQDNSCQAVALLSAALQSLNNNNNNNNSTSSASNQSVVRLRLHSKALPYFYQRSSPCRNSGFLFQSPIVAACLEESASTCSTMVSASIMFNLALTYHRMHHHYDSNDTLRQKTIAMYWTILLCLSDADTTPCADGLRIMTLNNLMELYQSLDQLDQAQECREQLVSVLHHYEEEHQRQDSKCCTSWHHHQARHHLPCASTSSSRLSTDPSILLLDESSLNQVHLNLLVAHNRHPTCPAA